MAYKCYRCSIETETDDGICGDCADKRFMELTNCCVWCSVALNEDNKSMDWCDPCCVDCAEERR